MHFFYYKNMNESDLQELEQFLENDGEGNLTYTISRYGSDKECRAAAMMSPPTAVMQKLKLEPDFEYAVKDRYAMLGITPAMYGNFQVINDCLLLQQLVADQEPQEFLRIFWQAIKLQTTRWNQEKYDDVTLGFNSRCKEAAQHIYGIDVTEFDSPTQGPPIH